MKIKLALVIASLALAGCSEQMKKWEDAADKQDRALFASWSKVNNAEGVLTYEQWRDLKDKYLLPGQTKPSDSNPFVPIFIYGGTGR